MCVCVVWRIAVLISVAFLSCYHFVSSYLCSVIWIIVIFLRLTSVGRVLRGDFDISLHLPALRVAILVSSVLIFCIFIITRVIKHEIN